MLDDFYAFCCTFLVLVLVIIHSTKLYEQSLTFLTFLVVKQWREGMIFIL